MKRKLIFSSLLFIGINYQAALAQNDEINKINQQVWTPFIQAYNSYDGESFIKVHSKEVVRVTRDNGTVKDYDQYKESTLSGFERGMESGRKRKISLRFMERHVGNTQAFEVGIYKVNVKQPDGKEDNHYGKFHVVLRKENGTWKILVDSDTDFDGTIGEEDYTRAKPMEGIE